MLARIDTATSRRKMVLSKPRRRSRRSRFRPSSRSSTKRSEKKSVAFEVVVAHSEVVQRITNSALITPSMTKIAWTKTRVAHQAREGGIILSTWEALSITTMTTTTVRLATLAAKSAVEEVFRGMRGQATTFSVPTVPLTTAITSSTEAVIIMTLFTNHEEVETEEDSTVDETCCEQP
jgi:hypothetical protein